MAVAIRHRRSNPLWHQNGESRISVPTSWNNNQKKGVSWSRRLSVHYNERYAYIFFSEQVLVAASHIPPAFLQSASVFAAVTSAAKAGLFRSAQIWRSNHRVQRYCGGVRPRRLQLL